MNKKIDTFADFMTGFSIAFFTPILLIMFGATIVHKAIPVMQFIGELFITSPTIELVENFVKGLL